MTATLSNHPIAHRPTLDLMVERAARRMLAWTERHAQENLVSHERMGLLRANESASAQGGSPVAR